jgi:dCTP deaminase
MMAGQCRRYQDIKTSGQNFTAGVSNGKSTEGCYMGFWSTETILNEQKKSLLISQFDEKRVKHGKYYLTLSREVAVTPDGTTSIPLSGNEPFVIIPPGQFAILFTNESVSIPNNAMGFISVRTSEKLKGLVNISGFHVDPGFKGHLKFSVYNAGNNAICLDFGSECFLLWFCTFDWTQLSDPLGVLIRGPVSCLPTVLGFVHP